MFLNECVFFKTLRRILYEIAWPMVFLERALLKLFVWSEVSWFSWHREDLCCVCTCSKSPQPLLMHSSAHEGSTILGKLKLLNISTGFYSDTFQLKLFLKQIFLQRHLNILLLFKILSDEIWWEKVEGMVLDDLIIIHKVSHISWYYYHYYYHY